MKQAHRFSGPGRAYEGLTKLTKAGPQWTGKIRTVPEALREPRSWRQPSRVFVNSMSDLFHEDVPVEFIAKVFAEMALTPRHTFQILTKRADRMRAVVSGLAHHHTARDGSGWPLPNVWLGVSVENQDQLKRIDSLKDTPAAVRFVSFEPLLEDLGAVLLDGIEWAIIGGESGSRARPCDLAWVRSLVRECHRQHIATFVKQLGARPFKDVNRVDVVEHLEFGPEVTRYTEPSDLNLKDRKGGDMAEWPADLQVREFPGPSGRIAR